MSQLTFHLLGFPSIELDGQPVHIERRRALAVAIYLAVTARPHGRDVLSTFFWPDYDAQSARADLRRTLYHLNRSLGARWLRAEDEAVQFDQGHGLWLDTSEFRTLLATLDQHDHGATEVCPGCMPLLTRAVSLYQADFLAGFSLADSPDFDDWQYLESEELRQLLAGALARLVRGHTLSGEFAQAITYARRALTLDPLNEEVHRRLMQLYAWNHQPTAVRQQYDQCVAMLADELEVPPERATEELYASIKGRTPPPPPVDPSFRRMGGFASAGAPADQPEFEDNRVVTTLCVGANTANSANDDAGADTARKERQRLLALVKQENALFGGHIQPLHGTDLFVHFGAEQAHEDDAERAVRAALAIRRAASGQNQGVHIGITTGMATVRHGAGANCPATSISGAVAQRALQMRNRSGTNQILIDRGTLRAVRGAIAYVDVAVTLPGAPVPVTAYAVERLRRHPAKGGIEGLHATLVGRADEMDKLRRLLASARDGRGQIAAIVGQAGVGKSRLAAELKVWAESEYGLQDSIAPSPSLPGAASRAPLLWLEGRGIEYASNTGYGVIADLFRGLWRTRTDQNGPEIAQNLSHTLHTLQQDGTLCAEDTEEIGPLLGRLLSVRFGTEWDDRLQHVDPEQIRTRTLRAVRDLMMALAQMQPLVLVFEDLQWADALSLDLVAALLDELAVAPLLLLCVYRPEAAMADNRLATLAQRHCGDSFTELIIRELTRTQSRALVASLLAIEALPASVGESILAAAQGNPLFLEEIVRGLMDSGHLQRVGAAWQVQGDIKELTVSDTLQRIVLSRVDQLPLELRLLLQQAAALGRLFRVPVLSAMMPKGVDLQTSLDRLSARAFIFLERSLPEAEYSFHHVLVRDAIYQETPSDHRAAYHRRAAEALERHYAADLTPHVETLAYHYAQSNDHARALPYLLQAGEKARRAYLNEAAVEAFQQSLQILDTLPTSRQTQEQRLVALTGLGQIYDATSQFEQAESYLRQAVLLGQAVGAPVAEQIRRYAWLGDLMTNWQPRPAEARQLMADALVLLVDDRKSTEAAMLYGVMAICDWQLGDHEHLKETCFLAAQFLEHAQPCEELRVIYGIIGFAYLLEKDVATSLYWDERSIRAARQIHDLRWLGEASTGAAYTHMVAGAPLAEFAPGLEEGRRLQARIGERRRANWADFERVAYALFYHEPCDLAHLTSIIEDARTVSPEHVGDMLGWLGIALLAQADIDGARRALNEMLTLNQTAGIGTADARVALGHIELAGANPAAAVAHFGAALTEMGDPDFSLTMRKYDMRIRSYFASALSGLERAYADPDAFRAFCHRFQATHAAEMAGATFGQWTLHQAEAQSTYGWPTRVETLEQPLTAPWHWCDPPGGASWLLEDGLVIRVPHLRDLWLWFLTAPRFWQPIQGEWIAQTICARAGADRPALGGLLLWLDKWNYLRLDWGTNGPDEVTLVGCINRREVVIGRGHLPAPQVHLRMERSGDLVRGLCSADGKEWQSVGQIDFATQEPVQIGLFAASHLDRYARPGTYADGTAIRFRRFQLWQKPGDITDAVGP